MDFSWVWCPGLSAQGKGRSKMYTSFYGMAEKPFQISTDPRFLWLGEKHREALASLKYGLLDRNGFVVLTGDVGTGKTTLVNALLDDLGDNVCVAKINHPSLETNDFLALIAKLLEPGFAPTAKSDLLIFFNGYLQKANADGKVVLLIIDEAHRLSIQLLEEIRLLSNIEHAGQKLLSIFFVGQDEIKPVLQKPECRALRQRVTSYYDIETLQPDETRLYVEYRLKVSGVVDPLFTQDALHQVYTLSGGNPRVINSLCDRALLTGYVKEQRVIDADIIVECGQELQLIVGTKRNKPAGTRSAMPALGRNGADRLRKSASSMWERLRINLDRFGVGAKTALAQGYARIKAGFDTVMPAAGSFIGKNRRKLLPAALVAGFLIFFLALMPGAFNRTKDPGKPSAMMQNKAEATVAQVAPGPAAQKPPAAVPAAQEQSGAAPPSLPDPAVAPAPPAAARTQKAAAALAANDYKTALALLEARPVGTASEDAGDSGLYAQALVGRAGEIMSTSPAEAEALLVKATEVAPVMVEPYLMLGQRYIRTKNYPKATDAYRRAIDLDPTSSDAFFNLGFLYASTGKYEEAEKAFEKVVSLKPAYLAKSLFNLAVIQQKLGKKDQSIANLEEVVALNPKNEKALAYLNQLRQSSSSPKSEQTR
jgi:type II secretory pathway predicted ATPase ExeA/Flp pilus assembly protein TadD